jgi:hypothetical protein
MLASTTGFWQLVGKNVRAMTSLSRCSSETKTKTMGAGGPCKARPGRGHAVQGGTRCR